MKNRQRIHALIATAAALTFGGVGQAQAQTTLTLSSWVPPTHFVVKDILQPWMAEVEKATEGRVKVSLLPTRITYGDWLAATNALAPGDVLADDRVFHRGTGRYHAARRAAQRP